MVSELEPPTMPSIRLPPRLGVPLPDALPGFFEEDPHAASRPLPLIVAPVTAIPRRKRRLSNEAPLTGLSLLAD
jgi:hypothetical protein